MYFLTIPLEDQKGKPKGFLYRCVNGGKIFSIPRVGEFIWIAPETKVKIDSVSYDGPELQSAHVTSEPISDEFKDYFLQLSNWKNKNIWSWRED